MLKKTHYLIVVVTENNKHYAYMLKVPGCNNLWSMLKDIPGISSANICDSMKAARELVIGWNQDYKNNGTYLFDSPSF